jgi:hypothetical protein
VAHQELPILGVDLLSLYLAVMLLWASFCFRGWIAAAKRWPGPGVASLRTHAHTHTPTTTCRTRKRNVECLNSGWVASGYLRVKTDAAKQIGACGEQSDNSTQAQEPGLCRIFLSRRATELFIFWSLFALGQGCLWSTIEPGSHRSGMVGMDHFLRLCYETSTLAATVPQYSSY